MTDNIMQVADFITQGKTKSETLKYMRDELAIPYNMCSTYYHEALKTLVIEDDLMADYRKNIQQANYDRLERIVNDTIGGSVGEKKVAIQAITELNRMCGSYDGNSVTIGNNKEGEQIIRITFDR